MLVNFAPLVDHGDHDVLIDPRQIIALVSHPKATRIFFGASSEWVSTPIEEVSLILKALESSPTAPQPYAPTREDWLLVKVIGEIFAAQFYTNGQTLGASWIAEQAKKICKKL